MRRRAPNRSAGWQSGTLNASASRRSPCIRLRDTSIRHLPVSFLTVGDAGRDAAALDARLANQFLEQNRGVLSRLCIDGNVTYDGSVVHLALTTSGIIGSLPAVSPVTGRPDLGIVVEPRYRWPGIGPMLASTGWRVVPTIERLPNVPRSARNVPGWLISATVLARIRQLLDEVERRFQMRDGVLPAPRGAVNWERYARTSLPRAAFTEVPCRYPELDLDRHLLAGIHYTARRHLESLSTQRGVGGTIVLYLIGEAEDIARRVRAVAPAPPSPQHLSAWRSSTMVSRAFRDGLDAIEWTIDERGLAGLSDLEGLPWILGMDCLFEAYVESLAGRIAPSLGATVRVGRKSQTTVPISWEPPYRGSQKALIPDIVLETDDATLIFDAKYKEHWEEISSHRWADVDEMIRERHRADILQVIAYSATARTKDVTSVLVYPCDGAWWKEAVESGRHFHTATIGTGDRTLRLILTAVPITGANEEATTEALAQAIRPPSAQ